MNTGIDWGYTVAVGSVIFFSILLLAVAIHEVFSDFDEGGES